VLIAYGEEMHGNGIALIFARTETDAAPRQSATVQGRRVLDLFQDVFALSG
jgi:hypothetical protein